MACASPSALRGLQDSSVPTGFLFPATRFLAPRYPVRFAAPLYALSPPLGVYFVTGNHEMFGGAKHYCDALRRGGFHVLEDERFVVDEMHIVGGSYPNSTHPIHLRHFLMGLGLKDGAPSILLQHVPNRLPIVEQAGVSLMISGHTH